LSNEHRTEQQYQIIFFINILVLFKAPRVQALKRHEKQTTI